MELIKDTEIMIGTSYKRYRNNDRMELMNGTEIMIGRS